MGNLPPLPPLMPRSEFESPLQYRRRVDAWYDLSERRARHERISATWSLACIVASLAIVCGIVAVSMMIGAAP